MASYSSFGSTILIGTTTGGVTYATPSGTLLSVKNISIEGMKTSILETSTISDRHKTYAPGMIDSGSLSFDVNFNSDDTGHMAILAQLDVTAAATAPVLKSFLITFGIASINPGTSFAFTGLVESFTIKGSMDEIVTASMSVKISGAVTTLDLT